MSVTLSFSDLERSLGIATDQASAQVGADEGFSDLERSLGIATAVDAVCSRAYWSFSDLERSLGIATYPETAQHIERVSFQ